VHRLAAALAVLATAAPARAGGLDEEMVSARSIGRAGTGAVSEDGGAALLVNPGGLVRRGGVRLQLAVGVHDHDASFRAADVPGAPVIVDRGPAASFPMLALVGELGPVVAGAAYLETGDLERDLPAAGFDQPADEVLRLMPHRYAGIALRYRRRTVAAGAAVRASSWLGLGASFTASQVSLAERRAVWGGFSGRLEQLGDPEYDLDLTLSGDDRFVPGAAAGALIAPVELPIEIAVAVTWSAAADVDGEVALSPTRSTQPAPRPGDPHGRTTLASPLTARAGLRYLGDRVLAEVGGELVFYPGEPHDRSWQLDGLEVADRFGVVYTPTSAPSLVGQRDHATVRAAVDVDVARGFLWLTAGWAYRTAGSRPEQLSPVAGDLGGHVLALGAEGQLDQVTLSIGYARSFAHQVSPAQTDVWIVDPFGGDSGPAAPGRYDRAVDSFGAAVEIAWE